MGRRQPQPLSSSVATDAMLRSFAPERGARPLMADVARLAGVSTATVSRALRTPDMVSAAMRAKIDAAIERLSYRRNLMAGALASARSMAVGIIIPSMINSFFSATIESIEDGLAETGYQLLIGNSRYSLETEERLIASFLAWSPAALVLTGRRHSRGAIRMLLDANIPIIEMWELSDTPIDTLVGFSQQAAGDAAAGHLIERGARECGFLGAVLDRDYRAGQRRLGFVQGVARAGLPGPHEVNLDDRPSTAGGAHAFRELMTRWPNTDAIFCTNDTVALGALFEARRLGIDVPQRVKICGFGDLEFAAASEPRLTTIRPPRREIGLKVAEVLRDRFESPANLHPPHGEIFDLGFELVARAST